MDFKIINTYLNVYVSIKYLNVLKTFEALNSD